MASSRDASGAGAEPQSSLEVAGVAARRSGDAHPARRGLITADDDHPGQPGDDEDAGEPRVGPTIISAPGPRSREWGHVRLSELAGRGDPAGFQKHIGPSFGLRFYPKHIYECLVTPEYTAREFRQRLATTPRHMLQEMLVAVAFPNAQTEALRELRDAVGG